MSRKGLMEQDLSKLDVTKLHPLSPEVISRQATINIGTIGHVAHGKSTVVKAISGFRAFNFCRQCVLKMSWSATLLLNLDMPMQRYTNVKMNGALGLCATNTLLFRAYGSGKEDSPMCDVPGFENCKMKLLRHVSFVDCR
ncbi:unnamed protein product [Thlaspi arvense]|uniref:Uncharacterized protein n=1 Tax=Thlaspi arvense TaxID=13288 RepID=A0AAU9S4R7_THLAR|nr:unnamed protein product [Thlaspi arvense]